MQATGLLPERPCVRLGWFRGHGAWSGWLEEALGVHAARGCVSAAQRLGPLLRRLSLAPRFAPSVAAKPLFPPSFAVSECCGLSSSAFDLLPHDPTASDDMAAPAPQPSRSGFGSAAGLQPHLTNSVCTVMPPPSPSKRMRSDSFDHIDPRALPAPAPAAAAKPAVAAATDPEAALSKALKSVVKIFCTSANPNYALPWQMMAQSKSTATGFVVAPLNSRRILTNAHAVTNQVQVMLRKHGNARKYPARVLAVGHECDIAMLTVDNDEFWTGDMEALEVGQLPSMQEAVMVVGFPTGGDNVCVTKGVVSRLDRQVYSHGRCALLTTQTDSAINSGNSGGPVLQGAGKLAGIAFQSLIGAENTGYVIPVPVVNHFLTDLERHGGRYTGFPEMGMSWQTLESTSMKDSLKLPRGATGVYITSTDPCYNASKELRVGDVLTHVQGHSIADDGTFLFEGQNVRIDFRHLSSMAYDGESLQLRVWRDGAAHELSVQVSVPKHLVLPHCHDLKPRYFIYAGLVFTRLTNFYLRHQYGADWSTKAPIKLCDRYYGGVMEAPGQEVVLLSKVLSADVNQGFQDLQNYQVYKVNGVKVHNLQHLAQLVERCESDYIRFELDWKRVVVLHTASGRAATSEILKMNAIASACSEGLMEEPLCLPPDLEATAQPSLADSEVVPDVAAEPIDADGGASGKDGSNGNNGNNNGMTAGGAASSSKGVQPPAGSSVPSSGAGAGMDTASAAVAMANGWARL